MAKTTKNLGLIQALFVGTTAPTNIYMLWYNLGDSLLYFYDTSTSTWVTFASSSASSLKQVLVNGKVTDGNNIEFGVDSAKFGTASVIKDLTGQLNLTGELSVLLDIVGTSFALEFSSVGLNFSGFGFDGLLTPAALTAIRGWTLPDKSGTLLVTSDVSGIYLLLSGGTMAGDINMNGNAIIADRISDVAGIVDFEIGVDILRFDYSAVAAGVGTYIQTWRQKAGTVAHLDDIKDITVGTITTDSSHTGDLVETVVGTITIPADTFQAGDMIRLTWTSKKETILATYEDRVYINTSADLTGTPQEIAGYSTNNRTHKQVREIYVKSSSLILNSFNKLVGANVSAYGSGGNNEIESVLEGTVDFTVTNYLVISLKLSDATETATLKGLILERKRPQ